MTGHRQLPLFLAAIVLFALYVGMVSFASAQVGTASPIPSEVSVGVGTRISNFLVQKVDPTNGTVSGLLYVIYPLAYVNGTKTALRRGDTIGYACDNTEWRLVGIDPGSGAALFSKIWTKPGPCPL
ncbi:MAG: hypothetical protein M1286_03110 [Candidatus Marsarchaeota archaeon]|nr:hypothetical protein [Candidatus Marsarchaeota archaeon]